MPQASSKSRRIGVVMDPIATINPKKDTSLELMLEAQSRGWDLIYLEMKDLHIENGRAIGTMRKIEVSRELEHWYTISEKSTGYLGQLDVILMRKDPPFDIEFIMATYILELASIEGCLVVNNPQSLRDANEKVFTSWFPQCCPPSLLTRSKSLIMDFLATHQKIVLKPTGKMGGQSIFVISQNDPNTQVILEEMTHHETHFTQAQAYIPEISTLGDKRIILINGKPIPFGITRIPGQGDHRGNLAVGATAKGFELSERDLWICSQIGPVLKAKGLIFVGIDIIGDYLTEINVTSPTGIKEIDKFFDIHCAGIFYNELEEMLTLNEST
jgi:glutathione synthase